MWVEELTLENIRCFESATMKFVGGPDAHRWVTFLSENGGGKSTALQALGLLLAGPEGAVKLLPRPAGWLRDETKQGKIGTRIHQDDSDPGQFGDERQTKAFSYSYSVTGSRPLAVNHKDYTEPTIVPAGQKRLSWLRSNALTSTGKGWFAAGYGAFRRLTRTTQIIVPTLEPQARYNNFLTQFDEGEPLATFERWMVYLDYQLAKGNTREEKGEARRRWQLGVDAINKVLPEGSRFDSVSVEGRIMFCVGGQKVPTISLSDGYRSILALAGDLVWRLILAFPDSDDPLKEPGVVLIDELDIHLHPKWQREISGKLRAMFPELQFFVATHSPFVAAGAGDDALTLRFRYEDGLGSVEPIRNIAALSVDDILTSDAFGLVSTRSPETELKILRYDELMRRQRRTRPEENELQNLLPFMEEARPFGGPPEPGSLDDRIERFLDKKLA